MLNKNILVYLLKGHFYFNYDDNQIYKKKTSEY